VPWKSYLVALCVLLVYFRLLRSLLLELFPEILQSLLFLLLGEGGKLFRRLRKVGMLTDSS
jgi:hypothetical protein